MVTYIPATNYSLNTVIISDNKTPADGKYAWYIPVLNVQANLGLDFIEGTRQNLPGISIGQKKLIINGLWAFRDISISSATDYDNLMKALSYWDYNNKLLYLSVKNGWDSQLAEFGTKSDPETLSQTRVKLVKPMIIVMNNEVKINIEAVILTK